LILKAGPPDSRPDAGATFELADAHDTPNFC
jgi:hypothetical protein